MRSFWRFQGRSLAIPASTTFWTGLGSRSLAALAVGLGVLAAAGPGSARAPTHAARAAPGAQRLQQSGTAAQVADWVTASGDNQHKPFVIIDKLGASAFVFRADGRLRGAAPVLVGFARGDDSVAGVGNRKLAAIGPDERTTPAGRFIARFGRASGEHSRVLWVDYGDAISMHPVVTTNPKEHRLQRIRSSAPDDHRISFGCINVPAKFYRDVVLKAVAGGSAVVYILPDTKPLEEVFPRFTPIARPIAAANNTQGPADSH
jgi:hypothetical protein